MAETAPLTPRRKEALWCVRENIALRGYAPTLDELAARMCIGRVSAWELVQRLIADGLMTADKYKSRTLRLTDAGHAALRPITCPHCGREMG